MKGVEVKGAWFLLMAALALPAQGGEPESRHQEAMAVTKQFMQQLGKTMKQAMKSGGPAAAIEVCAEQAPALTSAISRQHGWKVTRVGTRVRNPMLGMPDAWEQKVLARFQERVAAGEPIKPMAFSEVVEEPDGRYFRFMKAIPVKPGCLACHGPAEAIAPEVREILARRYPHDRATGYRAGELRGAVSIKQPLEQ